MSENQKIVWGGAGNAVRHAHSNRHIGPGVYVCVKFAKAEHERLWKLAERTNLSIPEVIRRLVARDSSRFDVNQETN